jgi:hypothetical protein
MMRLNIMQEYGIELKTDQIKSYAPDLLAAVYYYVGSLSKARNMLKDLDFTGIKVEDEGKTTKVNDDTSDTNENNNRVDLFSTELLVVN